MGCNKEKVVVLLASYNGEQYIGEQIESILKQTYDNIQILVSDDGSTDSTRKVVQEYCDKFENVILLPVKKMGGARGNFQRLISYALENTNSKYYMFSDQDDIWFDYKVEKVVNRIKKIEEQSQSGRPVLVYSNYYDFYGTDTNNRTIRYNEKPINTFSRIVLQNWLMGCTMGLNRELLELSCTIPVEADNHDAWVATLAALSGEIGYIHEPMILHRIHENNVTQQVDTTKFANRVKRAVKRVATRKDAREKMLRLYGYIVTAVEGVKHDGYILNEFENLLKSRGIKAYRIMRRNQFYGVDKVQNLLFFVQFVF